MAKGVFHMAHALCLGVFQSIDTPKVLTLKGVVQLGVFRVKVNNGVG